jgi:ornithine decarboxylase
MDLAHPMQDIPSFASVEDLVRQKQTDAPVFCFFPERARAAARTFVDGFPGEVLYAVKANPAPQLLRWFNEGGIRNFDVASIPEIAMVRQILPGCGCFYNHPIKPRRSIVQAYKEFGVRDFVVDHVSELDKVLEEVGTELTLEVRIASDSAHARINFGSKFGATLEEAAVLLRLVRERGARAAVCMHVGYQTTNPVAFAEGVRRAGEVVRASGVTIQYLNMGGGFPSVLMPKGSSLEDFFVEVAAARASDEALREVPLKCEPGSALAHPAGGVLAMVLAVKNERVYLNDGVYGALSEIMHTKVQPPTRTFAPSGLERKRPLGRFTVFGPTCDSYDTLPIPFALPSSLREGDWLMFDVLGAYSTATMTDFNGLGAHELAVIGS